MHIYSIFNFSNIRAQTCVIKGNIECLIIYVFSLMCNVYGFGAFFFLPRDETW